MLPLSPTKSALIKVPSASILPETHIKVKTDTLFFLLDGLEKGINDRARERAIVVHGAAYANPSVCKSGRLGRSFGCPALPQALTKPIINTIKGGSVLFIYANNKEYMAKSSILSCLKETTPVGLSDVRPNVKSIISPLLLFHLSMVGKPYFMLAGHGSTASASE